MANAIQSVVKQQLQEKQGEMNNFFPIFSFIEGQHQIRCQITANKITPKSNFCTTAPNTKFGEGTANEGPQHHISSTGDDTDATKTTNLLNSMSLACLSKLTHLSHFAPWY